MTVAIELEGVSKVFGDVSALDQVTASVCAGCLTGLVGPDGAGKTTLMRILAGLMRPSSGRALVAGHDTAFASEQIHRETGYMPQRFGLYEDLSVIENLDLYADLRGLDHSTSAEIFARLLHFTGLEPFRGRLAGNLSGGMKQKLGLACALMARPKVLLLDEPSVGVDPVSRRELWDMVRELAAEGMAIVWSTAYLDEVERCDEVLLLDDGRLLYDGVPGDLTRRLQGRSYLVRDVMGDRRRLLTEALALPAVRDGVIEGAAVRLVMAGENVDPDVERVLGRYGARLQTTRPRFEDAFIDLLGGGPGGDSVIAGKMDPVDAGREVMVQCRQLTRHFGDFTATDRVSFEVKRGEIFGLLGPNGAGKSTTFKMLCGLLKPSSGTAEVAGHNLRSAPSAAKQQLGYMAQKFSLYGLLSVGDNLEFYSGVYGLSGQLRKQRVQEMIDTFDLRPHLGRSPDDLPLGFKQRMALACSLMHRPAVLFLDEPTSGVDPLTRREFWTHITGLASRGVTIMVTTHFMDEAEYCDRVALINRGQVIALDTPDGLKARARTSSLTNPTMEDAFVTLVQAQDAAYERDRVA